MMYESTQEILVISQDSQHLTALIDLLAAPDGAVIGSTEPESIVESIQRFQPALLIFDHTVDAFHILHELATLESMTTLPVLIAGAEYSSELMNFNEWESLIVDQIPLHGPTLHKRVSLYLNHYQLHQGHCNAAFQAILDVSPERTICINRDLTISVINQYGISKAEQRNILGSSVTEFVPESVIPTLEEKLRVCDETRHRVQFEISMDGELYDILIAPIVFKDEVISFAISSQNITRIRQLEKQQDNRIKYDPVTGLPTRPSFNDFLEKALSRAKRNERTLALCYINLDHFKGINSSFGHDTGDLFLKSVSDRILEVVRASDYVARIGADEFAVILDEISRPEDAAQVAQKIMNSVSTPHQLGEHIGSTTASIGISFYNGGDETREELFKTADIAMIHAKESGRNEYRFFSSEMQNKALNRIRLEKDLRKAVQHSELELYYQPQVDAQTEQIVALEALLRWQHSELGMVSPAEFIPLAEETRLINAIGDWVMQNATKGNQEWWVQNGVTLPKLTVAINVSVQQLKENTFPEHIRTLVQESGIDPTLLEIEITETALMDDPEQAIETLKEIKAMGIRIAIDDFGTGYSSLAYIKRLPVDILKVDLTFVRDIGVDTKTEAIIKSTVSLAHNLGLKVVAEGVETKEQIEFLRDIKCDILQGYYYSKPLPAPELVELLQESFEQQKNQ